jgi:hypothetical protein
MVAAAALSILAACSGRDQDEKPRENLAARDSAMLVNRVWRVARSTGASRGDLVVFLSEGTLVFASQNGRPTFGEWTWNNGSLTMTRASRS